MILLSEPLISTNIIMQLLTEFNWVTVSDAAPVQIWNIRCGFELVISDFTNVYAMN
jgi:hypothetical protein